MRSLSRTRSTEGYNLRKRPSGEFTRSGLQRSAIQQTTDISHLAHWPTPSQASEGGREHQEGFLDLKPEETPPLNSMPGT